MGVNGVIEMTTQRRNNEMVNLLRADFFGRSEPNASWVHYPGAITQLAGLRGYWPMSAQIVSGGNTYARDTVCGYNLAYTNTPTAGYLVSATQTALPPWVHFVAASTQYLTYAADDAQHDILGTDTTISANERGLTLGGWFKFDTVPASVMGLMSKWLVAGNQCSYQLIKTAANNIAFEITADGSTVVTVTSAGTVVVDTWYFLAGRFDPSATLDVWIDNVKTSQAVAGTASIFNGTEPFQIGRTNQTNYFDGYASHCYLAAAQQSDAIINALWEQSRVMYGKGG